MQMENMKRNINLAIGGGHRRGPAAGRNDVAGAVGGTVGNANSIAPWRRGFPFRRTAWAADGGIVYPSILRGCMTKSGEAAKYDSAAVIEDKCYYHLGMFRRWTVAENRVGLRTTLQIDANLRWDGIYTGFRGLEYGLIRRAVTARRNGRRPT